MTQSLEEALQLDLLRDLGGPQSWHSINILRHSCQLPALPVPLLYRREWERLAAVQARREAEAAAAQAARVAEIARLQEELTRLNRQSARTQHGPKPEPGAPAGATPAPVSAKAPEPAWGTPAARQLAMQRLQASNEERACASRMRRGWRRPPMEPGRLSNAEGRCDGAAVPSSPRPGVLAPAMATG